MGKIARMVLALSVTFGGLISSVTAEHEYVFLLKGRGNVFWKGVREGIEETARGLGRPVVVLHTDDDQTPEAQLNMCLTALARRPSIIVMGAATKNVGIECFRKASAAGVLVADIDGNVTAADAQDAKVPMAFSVASDNSAIGRSAAEFLAKAAGKDAPRILIIRGLPGSIVSEQRAEGFSRRLGELLPKAVIVGSPTASWDRMKAMNTALDFMQREVELDFIFSVSDVMTTGVVEAVRVANKHDRVQILSVDGNPEGRKALLDGRMAANVAQLPYLMGKRAIELADDATLHGRKGMVEFTPTPLLTKAILENSSREDVLRYLR